jgi:peptidoglycan/xylan/chitin deacetylase (PgdA/CDA1 family)
MATKRRILLVIWLIGLALPLAGCLSGANAKLQIDGLQLSPTVSSTHSNTPTPFRAMTNTPIFVPPTFTPTLTFTPTSTNTPIPTDTPTPTDTPALVYNPPGHVIAPILLYHHVSDDGYGNRYFVTVDDFRAQMQALHDWGYTTITPSRLVDVLINGGELPLRPVLITFDDGNLDDYENAFPIMHELGFVGAMYIVSNRLQAKGYINVEQLQEMADDGWEIGSHAVSHADLTVDYSVARYEILQSRLTLEDATGEPVKTFAYPYGRTDEFVTNKVSEYGYQAGMGLGTSYDHSLWSLFYLSRIEVQGDYDLSKFKSLLPWSD